MNLKEELIKLRNILTRKNQDDMSTSRKTNVDESKLTEEYIKMITYDREFMTEVDISPASTAIANYFKSLKEANLDSKVDEFIKWVRDVRLKNEQGDLYKYREPERVRNFIEKMAVWYELRYPSYEINRLMPCCGQEITKIDNVMFRDNLYINKYLGMDNLPRGLLWADFYNKEIFVKSLPLEERKYLEKHTHMRLVYVNKSLQTHFHLSPDGIIVDSERLDIFTNGKIKDEDVISKHIKDIPLMFKKEGIILTDYNEIKTAIDFYEQQNYFREELLNCVMYRIIERAGDRIGPRRAYLFAKEFGRNIDIPMMYAFDFADGNLRNFINTYIKDGGRSDLVCYENYFYKTKDYQRINTITIREILQKTLHQLTDEERQLYQELVNILNEQIDFDDLRREEIKQLRLERKLRKSKNKNI